LISKRKAAEWAISTMPEPWSALVLKSVAARASESAGDDYVADVLAFVEWVAGQAETMPHPLT